MHAARVQIQQLLTVHEQGAHDGLQAGPVAALLPHRSAAQEEAQHQRRLLQVCGGDGRAALHQGGVHCGGQRRGTGMLASRLTTAVGAAAGLCRASAAAAPAGACLRLCRFLEDLS